MADSKITALAALTTADPANDMFPVVDVSDTSMAASGTTKRISINNILACSPSATLASATITGDLTVDTNVLKVDTTLNRVGIGTASPAATFSALIGSEFLHFGFGANNDNYYTVGASGTHFWRNPSTTQMTLNSTGLGVGVTPNRNLDIRQDQSAATIARVQNQSVNAAAYSELNLSASGNNWGIRTGSTAANTNKLQFVLDPNGGNMIAATMDTTGNFLVAKTAPSGTTLGCELTATGVINGASANADNLNIYNTTASAYRFFVSAAGTVNATNATISAISDSRLKENVQDIDVGLNAILALKPRKFDWKSGKGKDIKGDRGFIAQEFETVFPNLIDEWKDEAPEGEAPYKSVRADLIPVLVKAIQELAAEVNALKNA